MPNFQDRGWLTAVFATTGVTWLSVATWLMAKQVKWNLKLDLPLWHTVLHLKVTDSIIFEVRLKSQDTTQFCLEIWRPRAFKYVVRPIPLSPAV